MSEGQCKVRPELNCHICSDGTTISCSLGEDIFGKRFVVEYCKDCAWPEHIKEWGFVNVADATKWLLRKTHKNTGPGISKGKKVFFVSMKLRKHSSFVQPRRWV